MYLHPFNTGQAFAFGNSLFEAVKLIRKGGIDKYKHYGYGIGLIARGRI